MAEIHEKDKMKTDQNLLRLTGNIVNTLNGTGVKWFICFGTLLSLVRDKVFGGLGDIDIGIIGDFPKIVNAFQNISPIVVEFTDDSTHEALHARCKICDKFIDFFNWKRKGGYFYHTYRNINSEAGMTFKGTPVGCFEPERKTIESFLKDLRYGRAMNKNGTWQRLVPGLEAECVSVNLPFCYGQCLDIWYPEWSTRRDNYGQSEAAHILTLNSCKGAFDA